MNYWFGDSAHVLHVAKTGNDANAGHAQQYPVAFAADAKLTIPSAVTAAASGDVIVVWPGTYAECVDIETAAKSLTLIGTHRHLCKITGVDDDTKDVVYLYDKCVLQNLTIENAEAGQKAVDGEGMHDCKIIDCTIKDPVGIDALYMLGSRRTLVKGCYIWAVYDALYGGNNMFVVDSIIITQALGTSPGTSRAVVLSGTDEAIILNSTIIAQPSYEKATGRSAELYESDRDLVCINQGILVRLYGCSLIANGYKPSGAHADSYCSGDPYCIKDTGRVIANNCSFKSWSDQNQSADAIGIYNSHAELLNCAFDMYSAGGTVKVFDAASARTIYLANTEYDSTQLDSNITVKAVPAGIAFEKAAKSLINKAIQNKSTGAIDYYDDDGETIILTLSPTDGESTITRTPS